VGVGGMVGRRCSLSAAADGREECYFVAGLERGGPGGEFAIAGDGDCGAVCGQGRITGRAVGEEVFDPGVRGNFHRLLGVTNGVFQSSKKEHADADDVGVCGGGHVGIVAPGRDWG
jgi:hypothetical protein